MIESSTRTRQAQLIWFFVTEDRIEEEVETRKTGVEATTGSLTGQNGPVKE